MSEPIQQRILVTGITSIHGWPIWCALSQACEPEHLFGICPPQTKDPVADNIAPVCITDQDTLNRIQQEFVPTSKNSFRPVCCIVPACAIWTCAKNALTGRMISMSTV
jgi:hypothetical protein